MTERDDRVADLDRYRSARSIPRPTTAVGTRFVAGQRVPSVCKVCGRATVRDERRLCGICRARARRRAKRRKITVIVTYALAGALALCALSLEQTPALSLVFSLCTLAVVLVGCSLYDADERKRT